MAKAAAKTEKTTVKKRRNAKKVGARLPVGKTGIVLL